MKLELMVRTLRPIVLAASLTCSMPAWAQPAANAPNDDTFNVEQLFASNRADGKTARHCLSRFASIPGEGLRHYADRSPPNVGDGSGASPSAMDVGLPISTIPG